MSGLILPKRFWFSDDAPFGGHDVHKDQLPQLAALVLYFINITNVIMIAVLQRCWQGGSCHEAAAVLASHAGPIGFADVVRAAQQRDTLTMQVLEAAAGMLGRAVSQLIFALNPSRVILAGPLTVLGDSLLEPLRASVKEMLRDYEADIPLILNSTMGEFNGALGAAALAVHQWKPARDRSSRKVGALV